jgi:hypothetical protein
MSAWMPAPAPTPEPATVSTCGHGISRADATTGNLRGRVGEEGEKEGERKRRAAASEGRYGASAAGRGGTDAMGKSASGGYDIGWGIKTFSILTNKLFFSTNYKSGINPLFSLI